MKKALLFTFIIALTTSLNAQVYMYGTTSEGGANNLGTIYRVDQNGLNFEKVYDFTSSDGENPYTGLTLGDNGKLYGFTSFGGQTNNGMMPLGTFFEFDPITEIFTVIEHLDELSTMGHEFRYAPTKGANGNMYFASYNLGAGGVQSVLSQFDGTNISVLDTLGPIIRSKLLYATDGNLYATTPTGGATGEGTIVKYDLSTDSLSVIHESPGAGPSGGYRAAANNPLFEASNGVLYGCSKEGGLSVGSTVVGRGNVFKINKDGTGYQNLYGFDSGVIDVGFFPQGGFVEKNGLLYFTTPQEQLSNVNGGVIYTINLNNNAVNAIHTLDELTEGGQPKGTMLESSNGRLYFTTNRDNGSILELKTSDGSVIQRHAFNASDGIKPFNDGLTLVDFSALSVDESVLTNLDISIFPNPVADYLSINNSGNQKIQKIDLYNTSGRLVYSTKSQESINLSSFESGIYFIQLEIDNGQIITKKIIKK